MSEIKYICYFDDWSDFMDGDLVIDGVKQQYDFISEKQAIEDREFQIIGPTNILNPFTEEEAKKHFERLGYSNVNFIYDFEGDQNE